MDDNLQKMPQEELQFTKRTDVLPTPLVNRITLIYYVFNDYLSPTLDETIENYTYDQNPEKEVEVWEHMAQVVVRLRNIEHWPADRMTMAVKALLGLSMGAPQQTELTEPETIKLHELWLAK